MYDTLTNISFLAEAASILRYNFIAAHSIHIPDAKTNTAATPLKPNLPVKPESGNSEAAISHTVYIMHCNAVFLSRFLVGSIKMPAFS